MNERVANQLSMRTKLLRDPRVSEFGFVSRVVGLTIETQGVKAALGSICEIERESGPPIEAQVVGFSGDNAFMMAFACSFSSVERRTSSLSSSIKLSSSKGDPSLTCRFLLIFFFCFLSGLRFDNLLV